MRTYKYQFEHQSNVIRLGNLLDDMHEVHKYFHLWQRQRYKDGLPYANYHAMSAHLTELKKTTHRHWHSLPSQAIQCESGSFSSPIKVNPKSQHTPVEARSDSRSSDQNA